MRNSIPTPNEPSIVNAQAAIRALLQQSAGPSVHQIIAEVGAEWSDIGDDPGRKAQFIDTEFRNLSKHLIRCGFLIHSIDSEKLYEQTGHGNTAELMFDLYGVGKETVSRLRNSYEYALAISEKLPQAVLVESQIRELRSVVGKDGSLKDKQAKVEKAAKIFEELYKANNGTVTAKDISGAVPTAENIASVKPQLAAKSVPSASSAMTAITVPRDADVATPEAEMDTEADDEEDAPLPKFEARLDDFIGEQLVEELSSLLGALLDHPILEDDLKDRFVAAFEKLGIEIPEDLESEEEQ